MSGRFDWEKANARERAHTTQPARVVKVGRAGDLPATPKQLAFLRKLGVSHPPHLNRRQAAVLISERKGHR